MNISGFIFVRRSGERKNTSKTEGIFTKTQDEDLGRFRTAFQDPVYEIYIYILISVKIKFYKLQNSTINTEQLRFDPFK